MRDYKKGTLIVPPGVLTESPTLPGYYSGTFPALYPNHDYAVVTEKILCPGGEIQTYEFDVWIDPSGTIIKKRLNPSDPREPVEGAAARLFYGPMDHGAKEDFRPAPCPFADGAQCEERDSLHKPLENPIITKSDGLYSWVVRPNYRYYIKAEAPNCTAATTDIFPVPPPWLFQDPYCIDNVNDLVRCPDAWLPCAENAADTTRCVPALELTCANQLTLAVNVVGNGSVTKDPDKATYNDGDLVRLTATPAAGWTFSGWSGDLSGSTNPASITMHANRIVTATFIQNQRTLCDVLRHDRNHLPDLDAYKFKGKKGEQVILRLDASPAGSGTSKSATLAIVSADLRHPLYRADSTKLPNDVSVTLPVTGDYYIGVIEQISLGKISPYTGPYCISLEALPETMTTFKSTTIWPK